MQVCIQNMVELSKLRSFVITYRFNNSICQVLLGYCSCNWTIFTRTIKMCTIWWFYQNINWYDHHSSSVEPTIWAKQLGWHIILDFPDLSFCHRGPLIVLTTSQLIRAIYTIKVLKHQSYKCDIRYKNNRVHKFRIH